LDLEGRKVTKSLKLRLVKSTEKKNCVAATTMLNEDNVGMTARDTTDK
jgi:hypothetical protein